MALELAVVSGKGGTGKTSITAAFAQLVGKTVIVDCDVDAANLHLVLPHRRFKCAPFKSGKKARILGAQCDGCGQCLEYCRFEAIVPPKFLANGSTEAYRIDELSCEGCGACVRQCPQSAIELNPIVSGDWFLSDTTSGPFVHAQLGIAQGNSGRLVSKLRNEARQLASARGLELILIDGPPGVGCPVIASITGASFVMVVAEPSMSSMHDLRRLLELIRHFDIPAGVCVNKSDINVEVTVQIERLARAWEATVLGRVPFDPAVTEAQIAGNDITHWHRSAAAESIRQIWRRTSLLLEASPGRNSGREFKTINKATLEK